MVTVRFFENVGKENENLVGSVNAKNIPNRKDRVCLFNDESNDMVEYEVIRRLFFYEYNEVNEYEVIDIEVKEIPHEN